MRFNVLLVILAALVGASAAADAQPRRGEAPQFGTLPASTTLASKAIEAGGPDRNSIPGSGCSGFILNAAPTAKVSFGGGGPLSVFVVSGFDTTLLIADPAGRWHCSDDANGSNPGLTFANAAAGDYTVWVGTFSPEQAGTAATLKAVQGPISW